MAYRPVILSRQKFLASGALTFPENTKFASFKGIGGGGSGGSGGGANAAGGTVGAGGGGGGAADMGECVVDVNPALGYTVTIGAGGAAVSGANAAPGNPGNPGGDTMVTETVSGNIVAAFRGASGGWLGNTPDNVGTSVPGADQAPFGATNAYESVLTLTTAPGAGGFGPRQPLPRSGGLGGPSNIPGGRGASDYRTDTSVTTSTTFFTGGGGGPGGGPGNGGGGGGGGGSALGFGGAGGPGAGGSGLPGAPAAANTGAGGGGGGGAGAGGVSGGSSGAGGSGYVEVIAYGFA